MKKGCRHYLVAIDFSPGIRCPVTNLEWRTRYTNIPRKQFLSVANSIQVRPTARETDVKKNRKKKKKKNSVNQSIRLAIPVFR